MSLGIAFKGAEGIVLAADSRVTLMPQVVSPIGPIMIPATYDSATKLLQVSGQNFVGVVTYGAGVIGLQTPRTAHSYIPEFEAELAKADTNRLPVLEFAQRLSDFFLKQWQDNMPQDIQGSDLVFLVGGYNENEPYGHVFEIFIPSRPKPNELNAGPGAFGIAWGGQREITDRLVQGFDPNLPGIVQQFLGLPDDKRNDLDAHLRNTLSVPIPYPFLPLQDCVDLCIFLIRTTITIQTWSLGIRGVGGAIDVATITKTDGFQPIQRKKVTGDTD